MPYSSDDLDKLIEQEMRRAGVPGLAVGVIDGDRLTHARGFGVTSVEDPLAVTTDTLFRIGSLTKMFTATVIMRLVELGIVDLDCPITRYDRNIDLPGYDLEKMNLRLLLSHRSGLPNGPLPGNNKQGLIDRSLPLILRCLPTVAAPGMVPAYSNLGIVLAGHLAQVETGKSFAELAEEFLFGPLGMARTTFDPSIAMTYRVAQEHCASKSGGLAVWHAPSDYPHLYPGLSAFSTINDLAKFSRVHFTGAGAGSTGALGLRYRRQLHQPQADWMMGDQIKSGLGCYIDSHRGWKRIGHPGRFFSSGSKIAILPDLGVGAVLLYNYGEGSGQGTFRLRREVVFRALYEFIDVAPADKETAPSANGVCDPVNPSEYVGNYVGQYRDGVSIVSSEDEKLRLRIAGTSVSLNRQHGNIFAYRTRSGREKPWNHIGYNTSYDLYVGLIPAGGEDARWIMVNGKPYRQSQDRATTSH